MEFKAGDYFYFRFGKDLFLLFITKVTDTNVKYEGLNLDDNDRFNSMTDYTTAVELWKPIVVKQSQVAKLLKLQGWQGNEWELLQISKQDKGTL